MARPKNSPETEGLLSFQEIADIIGISRNSVKAIYDNAVKKMQTELAARELTFETLCKIHHSRQVDVDYR